MPIYGFQCQACGHRFDRLQKIADPDPTECPSCAANAVLRQLSAPQFRLSGGGWYETDFKKDGDKKRNLAGEGGGDKSLPAPAPMSSDVGSTKPNTVESSKTVTTTVAGSAPSATSGSSS